MNPPSSEIFTDVRKAYRLLHDYQRMVMDALKFIGGQLEMPYNGGWHKYCSPAPRNGKGILDNLAWDWLGQIFYEFNFVKEEPDGTPLRLSALHMPDTGALSVSSHSDPADFPSVGKSTTRIAFIFTRSGWDLDFTSNLEERLKLAEEGILPARCTEKGMLSFSVGVEELTTEASATQLIERIRREFSLPAPISNEDDVHD